MANSDTPLSRIEKGPWPSFVKEFKKLRDKKPIIKPFLLQSEGVLIREQGFQPLGKHWGASGPGGDWGLTGWGGRFHLGRVNFPEPWGRNKVTPGPWAANFPKPIPGSNQPGPGWFYTSDVLRKGLWTSGTSTVRYHQHARSTGDMVLLGLADRGPLEPLVSGTFTRLGFRPLGWLRVCGAGPRKLLFGAQSPVRSWGLG